MAVENPSLDELIESLRELIREVDLSNTSEDRDVWPSLLAYVKTKRALQRYDAEVKYARSLAKVLKAEVNPRLNYLHTTKLCGIVVFVKDIGMDDISGMFDTVLASDSERRLRLTSCLTITGDIGVLVRFSVVWDGLMVYYGPDLSQALVDFNKVPYHTKAPVLGYWAKECGCRCTK
jgi:hypothetical protein